jgi:hypothetical protein
MLVRAHCFVLSRSRQAWLLQSLFTSLFSWSQPDLVNHIQRVAIKGAGSRRLRSIDTEPNFYAMVYIGDEAMAVARMPPADPTTREGLRLARASATQNFSARLANERGAQQRGDGV